MSKKEYRGLKSRLLLYSLWDTRQMKSAVLSKSIWSRGNFKQNAWRCCLEIKLWLTPIVLVSLPIQLIWSWTIKFTNQNSTLPSAPRYFSSKISKSLGECCFFAQPLDDELITHTCIFLVIFSTWIFLETFFNRCWMWLRSLLVPCQIFGFTAELTTPKKPNIQLTLLQKCSYSKPAVLSSLRYISIGKSILASCVLLAGAGITRNASLFAFIYLHKQPVQKQTYPNSTSTSHH